MKYFATLFTLFLISCGDNTNQSLIKDVTSIKINESNISIYATDYESNLTATVYFTDGSSALGTGDMAWSSSDTNILGARTGSIYATKNGGDANVSIDYQSMYGDTTTVHIKELLSINFSDLNLSITDEEQIIYVTGNFENNETNVTMQGNILWTLDGNATVSEANATAVKLTVDVNATSVELTATLFEYTDNNISFSHTFY